MKKFLVFILVLISALQMPNVIYAKEQNQEDKNIKAKSVILMSLDTKEVLLKQNEYMELSPASVTKIMSILLTLEALESKKISLNDKVSASSSATSMGGSQIWLEVGEAMTVDELLKAVIVASANDACTALGEHIAGSDVAFVKMMNDRAKELGLKHTNFENCTGLDDTTTNHYSCAYDLAIIACEVMKYENIVTKYSKIWLDSLRNGKTELNNTNKLVNKYNGITGLKTGTTSNAGFCIAATATRDNLRLVAVVLGADTSDNRFNTATYLLDYGFANYQMIEPKINSKKITKVNIKNGREKTLVPSVEKSNGIVTKKGSDNLKYKYNIPNDIKAPINKGQNIGSIDVILNNKTIKTIKLYSPKTIKKVNILFIYTKLIRNIWNFVDF